MAARSPALASTGPEVARKFTPSSRAMICASVVLPSPGGPNSSTWSSASPRPRAASMKTLQIALGLRLADELGQRLRPQRPVGRVSTASASPETRPASPAQLLQRRLDHGADSAASSPRRMSGLRRPRGGPSTSATPQAHQGGDRLAGGAAARAAATAWAWKAATGPSAIGLSFSSVTMRWASLGPTPLARGRRRPCRRARTRRPARPGASTSSTPSAALGPTPWIVLQRDEGAPLLAAEEAVEAQARLLRPLASRRAAAPRRRAAAGAQSVRAPQRTT